MVIRKPVRWPIARPDLPRTSSSGSGFFFCGIMLLPVADESASSKNPNSSPVIRMKSSAMRDRCTIDSDTACRKLTAKSRSDEASMLLAHDARKAEARGQRRGVDGVAGAGDRARAERQRVGFFARDLEPVMIAAQRGGVAQQEVRDQHRHGAAHVRVRRHQRVARPLGLVGKRGDRRPQLLLQQRNAAAQVQPQVDRHLLVARAAGVQAAAGVADARDQLALDEAVHVLVVAVHPRRILAALLEDRGQRVGNRLSRRRRRARRRGPAPRPTPGCRSRRLRRAGDRTETRRRNQTPRDREPSRSGRTRGAGT